MARMTNAGELYGTMIIRSTGYMQEQALPDLVTTAPRHWSNSGRYDRWYRFLHRTLFAMGFYTRGDDQ